MSLSNLFSIKYGALALLVLQNTFLVVFMHYSRVQGGPMYASSTAVTVMEMVKFTTCLCVIGFEKRSIVGLYTALRTEVIQQPMEVVKLSVPSFLYTVQNNLLYYALSHLDATTFQVGYQVKILTTAVFSVLMLGKSLSSFQWISLVVLTVGVCLAQLSSSESTEEKANTTAGFVAVLLAACTSGFSGVYFERILKNSSTTLWMRNVHMGISSIVLAFVGIVGSGDLASVRQNGFFYGYNGLVVTVILLQAIGGLVVAVVVKYADNILKGFAAAFSIITSMVLCYFYFDFHPNVQFMCGTVLVIVSMYMYSYIPVPKAKEDSVSGEGSGSGSGNFGDSSNGKHKLLLADPELGEATDSTSSVEGSTATGGSSAGGVSGGSVGGAEVFNRSSITREDANPFVPSNKQS